ncbi:MAG: aminopeptidase [Candidatus Omnitrophica bacterium]|nr:aminopeptidase [Candidatus Omnitrophota bacterium]
MIAAGAITAVFDESLRLQPQESCLVVTDSIKEPLGRVFYEAARRRCAQARLTVIAPAAEHGVEPPAGVAEEMLGHDVQLLITSKSLSHTQARRTASAAGKRIASLPAITEEIINRCLDIDYRALRVDSERLYNALRDAQRVRVTTALGTDIWFSPGNSLFIGQTGGSLDFPGAFGNLPEGEVSFSPADCNGVYVVDASFPELGILKDPLTFTVKDGVVQSIGGVQAQFVRRRLECAGAAAFRVAELGIGLNPKARISGIVLEDEKVRGTAHIAVGNNVSYGGTNNVPLHLDGVLRSPYIYCDENKIMENGAFLSTHL